MTNPIPKDQDIGSPERGSEPIGADSRRPSGAPINTTCADDETPRVAKPAGPTEWQAGSPVMDLPPIASLASKIKNDPYYAAIPHISVAQQPPPPPPQQLAMAEYMRPSYVMAPSMYAEQPVNTRFPQYIMPGAVAYGGYPAYGPPFMIPQPPAPSPMPVTDQSPLSETAPLLHGHSASPSHRSDSISSRSSHVKVAVGHELSLLERERQRTLEFVGSSVKNDINQNLVMNGHRPCGRLSSQERDRNEQMANLYSVNNTKSLATTFKVKTRRSPRNKRKAADPDWEPKAADKDEPEKSRRKRQKVEESDNNDQDEDDDDDEDEDDEGDDNDEDYADDHGRPDGLVPSAEPSSPSQASDKPDVVSEPTAATVPMHPPPMYSPVSMPYAPIHVPAETTLTADQQKRLHTQNSKVNADFSEFPGAVVHRAYGHVAPQFKLPDFPVLPEGYVPMLMSPQGLLIPLQFVPLKKAGIVVPTAKPVWTGGLISHISDPLPMPLPANVPSEPAKQPPPSAPMLPPSTKAELHPTERIAAVRICVLSKDCYERAYSGKIQIRIEETPVTVEHRENVDYYISLGNDRNRQLKDFSAARTAFARKFNILNGKVFDSGSDHVLHGLERDMREKKDYGLVREDLFDRYQKEKVVFGYQDKVLESYARICLDYTMRLKKFKKLLIRNRNALLSSKEPLCFANSAKSERLWRSFLKQEKLSQTASLISPEEWNSLNDSETDETSATDSKIRLRDGPDESHHHVDQLTPLLSSMDFASLTNYRSRLYETCVLRSENAQVSDQADLVELIEFFRVKSTLGDLYELTGRSDAKKRHIDTESHGKNQSANGSQRKHARRKLLNLTTVLDVSEPDEERVKWLSLNSDEIRARYTKAYPLPQGLSSKEIADDLKELHGATRPF